VKREGPSLSDATLEEAKAQFQKSWDAWKAWAKMEEVPQGIKHPRRKYPSEVFSESFSS